MKFSIKTIIIGSFLSLALILGVAPQMFAREVEATETETTQETRPPRTVSENERQMRNTGESGDSEVVSNREDNPRNEMRQELRRERLDERKKAVCESRQATINTVIGNVVDRSKNHYDRITSIYEISTVFYTEKGLTVADYETLVANVETAKTAASTANRDLLTAPKLSCESDGPQADVQAFRNKRLDKVDAFAAYRDDVKTLVKAIRDAAKTAEADNTSEGAN